MSPLAMSIQIYLENPKSYRLPLANRDYQCGDEVGITHDEQIDYEAMGDSSNQKWFYRGIVSRDCKKGERLEIVFWDTIGDPVPKGQCNMIVSLIPRTEVK